MKKILKFLNEQHWYLIGFVLITIALFFTYGCVSTTESLIDPTRMVNRVELENELNYLIGIASARAEDLNRQDAIKQAVLDAANVMSQTGSINPSGLINLVACIGAISFGLNRNQKLKAVVKESSVI